MPPHVRRGGTRGRSNTPRHATQACAGLSAGRSAPRTQGKFAAFDEFCKRLTYLENVRSNKEFRELADFFSRTTYLHLVPQLLKFGDRIAGQILEDDPFGQGFL